MWGFPGVSVLLRGDGVRALSLSLCSSYRYRSIVVLISWLGLALGASPELGLLVDTSIVRCSYHSRVELSLIWSPQFVVGQS